METVHSGNRSTVRRVNPRAVLREGDSFLVIFQEQEQEEGQKGGKQQQEQEMRGRTRRAVDIQADMNSFPNHITPENKEEKKARKNQKKSQKSEDDQDQLELFADYENDDLTDSETSRHLLDTDQEIIPVPNWVDRRRGRRRGKKRNSRRRKKDKKQKKRKIRTKHKIKEWNTLPSIWRALGKQVMITLNI